MKKCKKCGESKQENLVKDLSRPFGRRNECKVCRRESCRNGPTKNQHLKRTYGITLDQYNQILIKQNGCCWICKRHESELTQRLHVDHCHKTGKVRSLLCFNCNQGLGNFKDSVGLLITAAEYLKING